MQSAKVDGAFIIQPGNHLYDHSYVTSVLRAHPDKFVGALLANPTSVRLASARPFSCAAILPWKFMTCRLAHRRRCPDTVSHARRDCTSRMCCRRVALRSCPA